MLISVHTLLTLARGHVVCIVQNVTDQVEDQYFEVDKFAVLCLSTELNYIKVRIEINSTIITSSGDFWFSVWSNHSI